MTITTSLHEVMFLASSSIGEGTQAVLSFTYGAKEWGRVKCNRRIANNSTNRFSGIRTGKICYVFCLVSEGGCDASVVKAEENIKN